MHRVTGISPNYYHYYYYHHHPDGGVKQEPEEEKEVFLFHIPDDLLVFHSGLVSKPLPI